MAISIYSMEVINKAREKIINFAYLINKDNVEDNDRLDIFAQQIFKLYGKYGADFIFSILDNRFILNYPDIGDILRDINSALYIVRNRMYSVNLALI